MLYRELYFAVIIVVSSTLIVSGSQFFITPLDIDNGHALMGHVIKTLPLFKADCMDQCQQTLSCFSMNFYTNKDGSYMCDLNRSSRKQSPANFTRKVGYEYAEIPEKSYCLKEDCVPGKEALPNSIYMFNFTRFRLWNLLRTWDEARNHCKSLGDELASFRSELESRFAFETMVSMTKKSEFAQTDSILTLRMNGLDSEISLQKGAKIELINEKHALYLDGMNDFANVSPFVIYNSSFTFGVWIKTTKQPSSMIFSDDAGNVRWRSFQFRISPTFTIILYHPGDQRILFQSLRSIPVNEWVHLAFTYDLDTRNGTLYFNGTLEKYEVQTVMSPLKELQIPVKMLPIVGKAGWGGSYFGGFIRDLHWIQGVLNRDGIKRLKDGEHRAWIGLHDQTTEGVLQWSDGSSLTYQPMESPYNTVNRDCVALVGKYPGTWRTRNCLEKSYFICKKH